MKKDTFLLRTIIIAFASIISSIILTSCFPSNHNTGPDNTGSGTIKGRVFTMNGVGLSGVSVECDGKTVFTDTEGNFSLQSVSAGKLKRVNFSLNGYVSTQKIVEVRDIKSSYIEAALQQIGLQTTINTGSNSSVSYQGVKIDFLANSFEKSDGTPFSGTANVSLTYFNPVSPRFNDAFPGNFTGIEQNTNNEVVIESFGFIDVEITANGNKLQLAKGKTAKITFPLQTGMAGRAPASMPLWFYDKDKGNWFEYALANKSGNTFVGDVPHFSTINLDMKDSALSKVGGRVIDQNGNPLSNAWINLIGVDFTGGGSGYTENDGRFEFIRVKANSGIKLIAYYAGFYSSPLTTNTPSKDQFVDVGDIVVVIDTNITSGWKQQSGFKGFNGRVVKFFDSMNGWIAGDGIYRTTDGGQTWDKNFKLDSINGQEAGNAASFIDIENAWVISYNGIWNTNDGGTTWNKITIPGGNYYSSIFFLDINTGWIASSNNKIYRTTDGGSTWNETTLSGQKYVTKIFFFDSQIGYVTTYSNIIKTTDGGLTWTEINFTPGINNFNAVLFIDNNTGWITSGGSRSDTKIYKTTDGGNNWTEQDVSTPVPGRLNEIFFINSNTGWIVGDGGTIIYTTDGGDNWDMQFTGRNDVLNSVCFINSNFGWAVGGNYKTGVLLYTENGGKSQ